MRRRHVHPTTAAAALARQTPASAPPPFETSAAAALARQAPASAPPPFETSAAAIVGTCGRFVLFIEN
jgi:hypothetical protein